MTCKQFFSIAFLCLTFSIPRLFADGFSSKTASTLTSSKVATMECRYFTELLGTTSAKSIASQFDPIENTQVDTIVCCPMGWRFYNYPSRVDLTWKEPNKHPRNLKLFSGWKKMVDNLTAGGDPLRDALKLARQQKKRFIVSFRMNDSHYVHQEQFPTHNNFWRDHPEYRLGKDPKATGSLSSMPVFNYSVPQVRDFYFAVLEEICTNYDVDGVELDFQRAPRFFHGNDLDAGRAVMTAHVKRIREMLDKVGQSRGRRLQLGVRVLPTIQANYDIGLDVLAWDAAGHLDGITVSSSYVQTADVGIEDFVTRRKNAKIFGELNYLHVQLPGTGHDANDRRYVIPETYCAATLSFLERGADGVSFFNTYCVPRAELKKLTADLLTNFKDLDVLNRSDKLYTCYATPATMFGRIFPARNEKSFEMFIADKLPGRCKNAILRFETKASCKDIRVEAWLNGTKLEAHTPDTAELFPPVTVNKASPKPENLKYFSVPLSALKFGINAVTVKNADSTRRPCDFTAAELALYMNRANSTSNRKSRKADGLRTTDFIHRFRQPEQNRNTTQACTDRLALAYFAPCAFIERVLQCLRRPPVHCRHVRGVRRLRYLRFVTPTKHERSESEWSKNRPLSTCPAKISILSDSAN